MSAHIVLAEDDPAIAESLTRALQREGYSVDICTDGPTALMRAQRSCDLLLLDLGLPHMDGLEVCRALRAQGHHVPVLMLSARAEEIDTVVGLDAGADDYLGKPFRLAELLARVRALLRRHTEPKPVVDGRVRIDATARRVYLDHREVTLSAKEFDLLAVLVRESGRVVTREQLMREVWRTEWFGATKTLDMHISWLRRKLGEVSGQPRLIITVRGVGFRFEPGN
jgi:DNA-binding response OmpR family regulator